MLRNCRIRNFRDVTGIIKQREKSAQQNNIYCGLLLFICVSPRFKWDSWNIIHTRVNSRRYFHISPFEAWKWNMYVLHLSRFQTRGGNAFKVVFFLLLLKHFISGFHCPRLINKVSARFLLRNYFYGLLWNITYFYDETGRVIKVLLI